LRQAAERLADLETRLKVDHGSVRSSSAQKDPLYVEWRDLTRDFGGGALHARKVVSELTKAQNPYLRIRQYLTTANIPFVKKLISYSRKFAPYKDDIIQEGALGFMHAIEKYDRESGFALVTYAGFWVRQLALRGYERVSNLVYVPSRFSVALAKLRSESGLDQRGSDQTLGKKIGVRPREIKALRALITQPQSLDREVPGKYGTPASTIPARQDSVESSVLNGTQNEHIASNIRTIMEDLPERDRIIVMRRFGLDGQGERTLLQVATELGVTRERVRQLQNSILNRLRYGGIGAKLRKLAEDMNESP